MKCPSCGGDDTCPAGSCARPISKGASLVGNAPVSEIIDLRDVAPVEELGESVAELERRLHDLPPMVVTSSLVARAVDTHVLEANRRIAEHPLPTLEPRSPEPPARSAQPAPSLAPRSSQPAPAASRPSEPPIILGQRSTTQGFLPPGAAEAVRASLAREAVAELRCPRCKAVLPSADTVRCPSCNARTKERAASTVRCKTCGVPHETGVKECPRCRSAIE